MIFLGTAAGDLIPSPFCECPICAAARKSGERRHKRYHSMLLLDEENLIDFGPELGAACIEFGLSLSRLRNVFLTHFHEDRFAFSLLPLLQMARTDHPKLTFWMSAPARAAIEGLLKSAGAMGSEALTLQIAKMAPYYTFRTLEAYVETAVDDMRVLPVAGHHPGYGRREQALNYLFTLADGRRLLYACDTGLYPARTLEALAGQKADLVVMEMTFGNTVRAPGDHHLAGETFVSQLRALLACGAVREDALVYASHIGHKTEWDDAALTRYLAENAPVRAHLAYDGLEIE